jgi:hypothetical protein
MTTLALKTSLSAFLVAVPLSGALADNVRGDYPEYLTIDRTYTSSVGTAVQDTSYLRQLNARIAAAQTNLNPGRDGFVNAGAAAQAQAELIDIRAAVAAEAQANGGSIGDAAFQSLSARVKALQSTISAATNG